jgi:hypothetical protein
LPLLRSGGLRIVAQLRPTEKVAMVSAS